MARTQYEQELIRHIFMKHFPLHVEKVGDVVADEIIEGDVVHKDDPQAHHFDLIATVGILGSIASIVCLYREIFLKRPELPPFSEIEAEGYDIVEIERHVSQDNREVIFKEVVKLCRQKDG